MGLPRCAGIAPRGSGGCRPGFRREFVRLVVFVVLVFVCGSCGVVAVSSVSGRRLGGSAVRSACRARVRSCVGGVWLPAWRVRASLASLRGVLRGRRLSAVRRACLRVPGSLLARVPSPVRSVRFWRVSAASWRVLSVLVSLRAVRRGLLPLRFSFRRWRGLLPLRALAWRGLPPRVAGRVGVARVGSRLLAWVLVRFGSRRAFWAVVSVAGGLWPVVFVRRGGGGGSPRPAVWSASGAGSALWLSSPAVVSAVASGACPLSLALRVFRWPVRSAVLWALASALGSGAFRVSSSLLASFVSAGLSALGWRFSGGRGVPAGFGRGRAVSSFLRVRCGVVPACVSAWAGSASFSVPAVVSALRSLVRCLGWLASRSSGRVSCPPALRPALSACVGVALSVLAG